MKKLIAIAVVFALVAGVAFAVDLGGTVIGTVNVVEGSSVEDSEILASGAITRVRIEGSGETEDGKFGGTFRFDPFGGNWSQNVAGWAWWKPIDQLKVIFGNNPDGVWGKDGNTRWMFYQNASDSGVTNAGSAWGGKYYDFYISDYGYKNPFTLTFSDAFWGGYGAQGLALEIKPIDMIGINIGVPFVSETHKDVNGNVDSRGGDIYTKMAIQLDLNFDFGNIAVSMTGNGDKGGANVWAYFGLTAIENLRVDLGVGLKINDADDDTKNPFNVGLGVKYAADAFGIKFRTALQFPGDPDVGATMVIAEVLPYYAVSDGVKVFVSGGVGIFAPKEGDSIVGFHINPYVEIGQEWGPCFFAGIKLWSNGAKDGDNDAVTNWAVPLGLIVSF
jgi:hypothetical protein